MKMSDYIELDSSKKEDRVIRNIYTPKEVVKIIQKVFRDNMAYDLSRSERLLLWDFGNQIIMEFKDD